MKLFKYGLPFAALALLASCSNDNVEGPENPAPEQTPVEGYYFSIEVALPSPDGSRTTLDGFDDGNIDEYNVHDVTLYLFTGDSESAATYSTTQPLVISDWVEDDAKQDDITRTKTFVGQLNGVEKNSTTGYYGLLVINKGPNFPAFTETTFAAWNQATVSESKNNETVTNDLMPVFDEGGKNYFTMTNAPQAVTENGSTSAVTLVKIDTSKFVEAPSIPSDPAATFYVQRGVAKVKVSATEANKIEVVNEERNGDYISIKNWGLDNKNTTSFAVQNVTPFDTWLSYTDTKGKFTEKNANAKFNHIWWAVDPNYTASTLATDAGTFTSLVGTTLADDANCMNREEYCLENTMEAKRMIKSQTTRVVLKANYVFKDNNEAKTFVVYDNNGLAAVIGGMMVDDDTFKTLTPKGEANGEQFMYKLSDLIAGADGDGNSKEERLKKLVGDLYMMSSDDYVTVYKDGVTYYTAYIRHFDDDDDSAKEAGEKDLSIENVNTYDESLHLGRYGVLRNTSYQVNVTGVYGFGSPDIPTPGDGPDDEPDPKKYNLKVEIKILAWAKRSYDYIPK